MAKIDGVPRLNVQDFPSQSDWIGQLFDPLNKIIGSMAGALRGKITFSENIYSQTFEYNFNHNTALEITHGLNNFSGIFVINCEEFFKYKVVKTAANKISLTFLFDDSSNHNVKFIVLGGV